MPNIAYAGYRQGFPFAFNGTYGRDNYEVWDGSTVDSEGRPAPVVAGNLVVGPGTSNPIAFTFDEMVDYFWRQRKFAFSLVGTNSRISGFDGSKYVFTFSGGIDVYRDPDSDTPEELIGWNWFSNPTSSIFVGTATGTVTAGGTLDRFNGGGGLISSTTHDFEARVTVSFFSCAKIGDTYYPEMTLEMRPRTSLMGSLYTKTFGLSTGSGEVQQTSASVTIFGQTVPLWVIAFNPTNFSYPATGTSSTYTTTEWWGYDGKFNTTTGARL